ncbi:hypothetical protein MC378_08930 [Polaribacter sp. MSW13]|uniref:Uncharacterized protein n=1 Tax=Polaribacter marinus TaxID=2916838 RepID=A0A9X2AJ92_9FLAO|nr:hypothetical protein [Polaribacter marinus]MCI2229286.1 hypothetical protein [Polaribacter marinus]
MEKKNVVISFGKRAVLSRLLSAFFYAAGFYFLILFFLKKPFAFSEKYVISFLHLLELELYLIGFALPFSVSVSHHFNFDEMKYRRYYFVGPIGYGKWQKIKKLDRVSTFLNSRNECEVNIWDIKNKRYKIAAFDEIDNAVEYGRDLAKNLKIKFKERK